MNGKENKCKRFFVEKCWEEVVGKKDFLTVYLGKYVHFEVT